MNLLFISEYFLPKIMGGGEINLFLLAKVLAKREINVYILTSYHKGLKQYEEIERIKIYRRLKTGDTVDNVKDNFIRSFIFPKSVIKEIKKLDKEIKFDIIHFTGTSIIAAKNLESLGEPMFATIESYPTLCPKGDRLYCGKEECKFVCSFLSFLKCQAKSKEIGKMENKFCMKYNPFFLFYLYNYYRMLNKSLSYCKLIAISKYVKTLLKKHGLESKVIPNAIDVTKFYSKKRKSGKIRVLYNSGSLTKFKGPHILLEALKGLNCRCDIYGDGVMKIELNKMIHNYDLDAEIHTEFEPEDKVPARYADADIVVFPSIWPEPFGRIPIEAMATGKPVIGSNIGGVAETIEKGNGLLIKPGDVKELKASIKILAANIKLRGAIGKSGKRSVKNKYSEEVVVNKLIKEYRHLSVKS